MLHNEEEAETVRRVMSSRAGIGGWGGGQEVMENGEEAN